MPQRKRSKIENMGEYSSYNSAKRQRTTNTEKENIPIPGSYPTAPPASRPASYGKPTPLKTTIKNNPPMPPLEPAINEDEDEDEEEEEDNNELGEIKRPWINTPLYPGARIQTSRAATARP
ncbi:hypothetical protein BC826DRAFT_1034204, partial [Russula brevipes]